MSESDLTRQIQVDPTSLDEDYRSDGGTDGVWSFGLDRRLLVSGLLAFRSPPPMERPVGNTPDSQTDAPHEMRDLSSIKPVVVTNPYLGKRSFPPTYHWEGMVESLTETGFRGRLTPVEQGKPQPAKVEYADFDYDDLSDPTERALASPGAIFYWTVGRSTNAAGTITKQSLIRFRRLPPTSAYEGKRAALEAKELLGDLGKQ
jgi:hypothetical protein